jgi:hypothetical protein
MTERDRRAVALGMAIGAAIGTAIALLLAPKRGAELRDDLVRSAAKVGKTVVGSVPTVRGAVRGVLARARPLVGVALKPAGAGRADDSAELHARSRDMVAEGGPAGASTAGACDSHRHDRRTKEGRHHDASAENDEHPDEAGPVRPGRTSGGGQSGDRREFRRLLRRPRRASRNSRPRGRTTRRRS